DLEKNFKLTNNRQVYCVQIEGSASFNENTLSHGDAMQVTHEPQINIKALENAHILLIEMAE
ncbi:MAG: pirin family protein, partial [Sulfurospirillaceae bacterium]|nr:pirin family protein [Sulfurospirillaceae bacterium]